MRMRRLVLGVMVPMALVLMAEPTAAQTTNYNCSVTSCTVPSGFYGSPADFSVTSGSNYTGTNLGQFNMPMPGSFSPGNMINSFVLGGRWRG